MIHNFQGTQKNLTQVYREDTFLHYISTIYLYVKIQSVVFTQHVTRTLESSFDKS